MDVGVWLRGLGLEKYEAVFSENEIDETVLPNLTAEDLKELGVTALGHRRKLLDAIANWRTDRDAKTLFPLAAQSAGPPAATAAAALITQPVGERRHITVMFCDLVGSTSISAGLDAEEWRDLVSGYLDVASAAVTEMGGHVAKKLGDGLMSLFGYPVAQENDAERAARAALSIQRSLAEINRKNSGTGKPILSARIGIEAGPVVVDATGEIYGDTPNIAARVQATAEPGAVVITARVQHQVAGQFVAEDRGSHQLKGVPEPVTLFRLVRLSGASRRSGQRHLTPLVGRDEEIAMLMRRWDRARQGKGQLVLITGEPGLGKSRLIDEFRGRLQQTPHTWAEWSCSQILQNTALHPIAEWGRQRFGGVEVPAEQRLAEIESTLIQIKLDPAKNVPLLASLLDIPLLNENAPISPPEELRRQQLAALTNTIMASARIQPVVLTVEDLHWADPSTLDLVKGFAERGALVPLLILMTARPEFRPSWGARSHHGTISLVPLDHHQVRRMVAELAARHALSNEVIDDVTERTGGVPLFVEEVTRLLLERGEQGGIQAIPPTLQQSLMARIDRLGAAREVAQIGSVVGRDFSYRLLRSLADMEDAPLQSALETLAEADILLVQGLPPESEYRFKHALIQDAAYENLLKSRRQVLHRRIGETLRDQFPARATAEPELLAHHFTQAGLTEEAIEWWGKAGQRSLQRSALMEAVEQLQRALTLIADRPSSSALRRKEINLQVALINPIMHLKGYAASETKEAVERARHLIASSSAKGDPPDDPLLLLSVLYGLWAANRIGFNGDAMLDAAAQLMALAKTQTARVPLVVGHRVLGISLLLTGSIAEGRTHLDKAVALYDPQEHHSLMAHFGVDNRVSVLSYRSFALWLLGYPDAALADAEKNITDARELGSAATLMFALDHAARTNILCGNLAVASALADELALLADEKDASFWKGSGTWVLQGLVAALAGKTSDAVQLFAAGVSTSPSTGTTAWAPEALSNLAKGYAELREYDNASRCVGEAMTTIKVSHERWWESEVNRIAGEIALKSPETHGVQAEDYFERALAIARQQQAKSWELRAAMSLARLRRDQAKMSQARELLAPVYGWFTEGFDTRDLKEAKALLEELAP